MRKSWLLCVLLGTLAWGQAAPSAPPPPESWRRLRWRRADTSASVPASAAVINHRGRVSGAAQVHCCCERHSRETCRQQRHRRSQDSSGACKTVITKAEFEKLASALAPESSRRSRRSSWQACCRALIAMSTEAKKEGLDKTSAVRRNE